MILDNIENIDTYASLNGSFEKAIQFIKENNLEEFLDVKYEIDGDNVFVLIQRYISRDEKENRWESHKKYIDILNRSNFVIDYAHPDQSGITIRCYEAQSCGAKIITNNPSVFKDKHFNSDNTILLKGKNEIPTLLEKYNALQNIVPEKYNRSINVFVNDLLEKGKVESLPVKSLYLDSICIN